MLVEPGLLLSTPFMPPSPQLSRSKMLIVPSWATKDFCCTLITLGTSSNFAQRSVFWSSNDLQTRASIKQIICFVSIVPSWFRYVAHSLRHKANSILIPSDSFMAWMLSNPTITMRHISASLSRTSDPFMTSGHTYMSVSTKFSSLSILTIMARASSRQLFLANSKRCAIWVDWYNVPNICIHTVLTARTRYIACFATQNIPCCARLQR
jgi:hypothetical protein